jgi:hypothetical protein
VARLRERLTAGALTAPPLFLFHRGILPSPVLLRPLPAGPNTRHTEYELVSLDIFDALRRSRTAVYGWGGAGGTATVRHTGLCQVRKGVGAAWGWGREGGGGTTAVQYDVR